MMMGRWAWHQDVVALRPVEWDCWSKHPSVCTKTWGVCSYAMEYRDTGGAGM